MKRTTEQSNRPSHRGRQLELTGERETATGRPTPAVRNQSATLFCANKQESVEANPAERFASPVGIVGKKKPSTQTSRGAFYKRSNGNFACDWALRDPFNLVAICVLTHFQSEAFPP